MRRRTLLRAAGGAGTAGLTGLAGCLASTLPGRDPTMGTPPDVDAPTGHFVAGNANVGLALLSRLAADAPGENRLVSPYSVGVALAMTYAGARGETRSNVAETMRFRPRGEDLHRAVAALRADIPLADASGTPTPSPTPAGETPTRERGVPFRLLAANALWGQEGFPFREPFLATLERYYGAGLGEVDFAAHHRRACERINRWVSERTEGEIPELFPGGVLGPRTRLVLANAVYFRANWADTFPPEATEPAPFTALDGSESAVPTMRQQERFLYAEVDGTQVVELPYAGGDCDLAVLLPPAGEFRSVERSLDADRLAELFAATEPREGTVRLPRFSFRSKLRLGQHLQAMGMTTAFGSDANFTGMAEGPAADRLRLGAVLHEATITVDEEGTEAAAATGVEVEAVSAPANPFEFVADRPFLFAIRHRPTGAPLFLGRVVDAAAAQQA